MVFICQPVRRVASFHLGFAAMMKSGFFFWRKARHCEIHLVLEGEGEEGRLCGDAFCGPCMVVQLFLAGNDEDGGVAFVPVY